MVTRDFFNREKKYFQGRRVIRNPTVAMTGERYNPEGYNPSMTSNMEKLDDLESDRIINGLTADKGSWPWIVAMHFFAFEFGGGALCSAMVLKIFNDRKRENVKN